MRASMATNPQCHVACDDQDEDDVGGSGNDEIVFILIQLGSALCSVCGFVI